MSIITVAALAGGFCGVILWRIIRGVRKVNER